MAEAAGALDDVLRAAQERGLLPPEARLEPQETRPWPVVLLIAVGAWFAAIPLMSTLWMVLGDALSRGAGFYVVGALLVGGAAMVLRQRGLPVFAEQLALPALLAGGGALAFALARDLREARPVAALLLAITLLVAAAIPRGWLRVLAGALSAMLSLLALGAEQFMRDASGLWLPLHLVVLAGLSLWWLQARVLAHGARAAGAAALEPFAAGWLLAALANLAWWSGMTLLVAGVQGAFVGELGRAVMGRGAGGALLQAGSVLLALLAAGVLARAWPTVRGALAAAVAAVLALLAWFLPALGATLLVLAAAGVTRRWRIAGVAALTAAWVLGAFYYQLAWPLATKALVLATAGALLAGFAWLALPREAAAARQPSGLHAPLWIATAAIATLAFANYGIWEKERLIARGEKIYVALAPVDPRSLVQGDYMRLGFRVPDAGPAAQSLRGQRPFAIARRDARGVAELLRIGREGETLAAGEFRIELTARDGAWTLPSNAWFFREGDAKRWEAARFAEFRIDAAGHVLLVGLADQQLRSIPVP